MKPLLDENDINDLLLVHPKLNELTEYQLEVVKDCLKTAATIGAKKELSSFSAKLIEGFDQGLKSVLTIRTFFASVIGCLLCGPTHKYTGSLFLTVILASFMSVSIFNAYDWLHSKVSKRQKQNVL